MRRTETLRELGGTRGEGEERCGANWTRPPGTRSSPLLHGRNSEGSRRARKLRARSHDRMVDQMVRTRPQFYDR